MQSSATSTISAIITTLTNSIITDPSFEKAKEKLGQFISRSEFSQITLEQLAQILQMLAQSKTFAKPEIFDIISLEKIADRMSELVKKSDSITTICKAYSALSKLSDRGDSPKIDLLTKSFAEALNAKIGTINYNQAELAINALARLGYKKKSDEKFNLSETFLQKLARPLDHISSFTTLSLVKMEMPDEVLAKTRRGALFTNPMSSEELRALILANIAMDLRGLEFIPPEQIEKLVIISRAAGLYQDPTNTISPDQIELAHLLKLLGFTEVETEYPLDHYGVRCIDVCGLTPDGVRVLFEYDGKKYHDNKQGTPNAHTLFRDEINFGLASRAGDTVCITLSSTDFEKHKDEKSRLFLLRQRLQEAGITEDMSFTTVVTKSQSHTATTAITKPSLLLPPIETTAAASSTSTSRTTDTTPSMSNPIITQSIISRILDGAEDKKLAPQFVTTLLTGDKGFLDKTLFSTISRNKPILLSSIIAAGLDPDYTIPAGISDGKASGASSEETTLLELALSQRQYQVAASLIIAGASYSAEMIPAPAIIAALSTAEDNTKRLDLTHIFLARGIMRIEDPAALFELAKQAVSNNHDALLSYTLRNLPKMMDSQIEDLIGKIKSDTSDEIADILISKKCEISKSSITPEAAASSKRKETKPRKSAEQLAREKEFFYNSLRRAIISGNNTLIQSLIEEGNKSGFTKNIFSNKPNYEGWKLFIYGCGQGNPNTLESLLSIPEDINPATNLIPIAPKGKTTLAYIMVDADNPDNLTLLLNKYKADPNKRSTKEGKIDASPMDLACEEGNTKCALILLEHGASVISKFNKENVILSCCNTKTFDTAEAIIRESLKRFPDTIKELQDSNNLGPRTPLYAACYSGARGLVRAILESPLKTLINEGEYSAFDVTILHGYPEIAIDLLDAGISLTSKVQKSDSDHNALHIACNFGHIEVVKKILESNEKDAIINHISNKGTPLFLAIQKGRYRIAKLLVDAGADIDLSLIKIALTNAKIGDYKPINFLLTSGKLEDIQKLEILQTSFNERNIDLATLLMKDKYCLRMAQRYNLSHSYNPLNEQMASFFAKAINISAPSHIAVAAEGRSSSPTNNPSTPEILPITPSKPRV